MPRLPAMLLDGRAPSPEDLDWLLASRALAFGEGVFTSVRVYAGRAVFLDDHFWRLRSGLESLQANLSVIDWPVLKDELVAMAQQQQEGAIKIMLLAGPGGVGYHRAQTPRWHRLLHPKSLPLNLQAYQQGIKCWWQACPGSNPQTASKHLNRLSQVLASQGCPESFPEALQYNRQGEIIEGIARNVFWFAAGCWHTPSLTTGALAGVMRRQLLRHLKATELQESEAGLEALQQAEEVFVCNSLQGIWPVTSLHNSEGCLAGWPVGSETQKLMAEFHPLMGLPQIQLA